MYKCTNGTTEAGMSRDLPNIMQRVSGGARIQTQECTLENYSTVLTVLHNTD